MKHLNIAFVDFWQGFDYRIMNFYLVLTERYEVEVKTDFMAADYVFFSCFGDTHWLVPLSKVKIFVTAENICPDFNTCDYAIGFEWMDYGDRYLRFSNAYSTNRSAATFQRIADKHKPPFVEKTGFCGFVVSNAYAEDVRVRLFHKLSGYKRVDSGGRWMNNVGAPVADKYAFDRAHKFSLCCENSRHSGYTTEKLYQAFAAQLVPIYWGDPDVCRVFNPKAFVHVSDFPSLDAVVGRVKEIDQSSELYEAMLRAPALLHPERDGRDVQIERLRNFMWHIFDQPHDAAFRFNRREFDYYYPSRIARHLRRSNTNPLRLAVEDGCEKAARIIRHKLFKQ